MPIAADGTLIFNDASQQTTAWTGVAYTSTYADTAANDNRIATTLYVKNTTLSTHSWNDASSQLTNGTAYYNSTTRPILVVIVANCNNSTNSGSIYAGGVYIIQGIAGPSGETASFTFIVPPGAYYWVNLTGGSLNRWMVFV